MKKVTQKIYKLANESGVEISKTDNLLVSINGTPTAIKLKDLFEKYEQKGDHLKGYSILGESPILENCIQISKEIAINFFNKNTDEQIYITKISEPLVQMADKEINDELQLGLINDEFARINEVPETVVPVVETEEPEEEEEKEEVKEEVKAEDKSKSGKLVQCSTYDDDAQDLIDEGYEELENENWRLLYLEGGEPEMILALLVTDKVYQKLKIQSFEMKDKSILVKVKSDKSEELDIVEFIRAIEEEVEVTE